MSKRKLRLLTVSDFFLHTVSDYCIRNVRSGKNITSIFYDSGYHVMPYWISTTPCTKPQLFPSLYPLQPVFRFTEHKNTGPSNQNCIKSNQIKWNQIKSIVKISVGTAKDSNHKEMEGHSQCQQYSTVQYSTVQYSIWNGLCLEPDLLSSWHRRFQYSTVQYMEWSMPWT